MNNYLGEIKRNIMRQSISVFPELKDKEDILEKKVKESMMKNFVNHEMIVGNQKTNMSTVISYLSKKKPILTTYGAIYMNQDEKFSMMAYAVTYLINDRKVYKNKMFEAQNMGLIRESVFYDLCQKTFKILANSAYGASIEKNCIFYDPHFGPSITYTGRLIITTAVNIFEKFLANNIMFRCVQDTLTYIDNIIHEEDVMNIVVEDKTVEEVFAYLGKKIDNVELEKENLKWLYMTLKNLNQKQLNQVYYKNNLIELTNKSETVKHLFSKVMCKDDFLNPNEPDEKLQVELQYLWDVLEKWVFYNHLDFYRYENAENRVRKAVLTIDTDSNFLYLYPLISNLFDLFDVEDTELNRMTTSNIFGWLLGNVIKEHYWLLTTRMNVPPAYRPILNMKNEFYYSRLMLTRNKKNYAGRVMLQEGNMLPENKQLDIKGLAIKKVTVNKTIREFFTEMLKEDILKGDINYGAILGKFKKLETPIRDSLKLGETFFTKPEKVNQPDSYKNPYTMMPLRGILAWNALFPDKEVPLPNKVNIVKLKFSKSNSIDEIKKSDIPDLYKERILNLFKDDSKLASYGFCVLSLPKLEKQIPEWLIKYVDIETIIVDNITPGLIILESLGFKIMDVDSSQLPTNVINF